MKSEQEVVSAFRNTANDEQQAQPAYQQSRLLLEVLLDIRGLLVKVAENTTKKAKTDANV